MYFTGVDMEALGQLQKILDDKPKGSVSIFESTYIDGNNRFFHDGCWYGCNGYIEIKHPTRSLADIQRIVDLMKATKGLLENLSGSPDGYWRNEIKAARQALGYNSENKKDSSSE
jgi:hypothetical protein